MVTLEDLQKIEETIDKVNKAKDDLLVDLSIVSATLTKAFLEISKKLELD